MTGVSKQGTQGFVPKEGVPFAARLRVLCHPDELEQIDQRRGEESRSDWVRAAIREKLHRDSRAEREYEEEQEFAERDWSRRLRELPRD